MIAVRARPWLLLPIETKAREFHAKLFQAAIAAERGFDVVLGEQASMQRYLRFLPRGVYIDKSVARSKTKTFRRGRRIGNRIVAWCEEGLVYRDCDTYLHERVVPESMELVDRFFAWGDVQSADIRAWTPSLADRVTITGNPRFDVLRPGLREVFRREADAIRAKWGPFVMVNTNFARFNHFYGRDWVHDMLRRRGIIDTAERAVQYQRLSAFLGELYRAFAEMLPELSRSLPGHRIVVRPHPSENHSRWRNEVSGMSNVHVVHEGAVAPWLMAADLTIHNSCTTGVEAYLLERPVVAYQPVVSELFDSFLPHAVSRIARTPQELATLAQEITRNGEPLVSGAHYEASRYVAALDGAFAADRVVDALELLEPPRTPRMPAATALAGRSVLGAWAPVRNAIHSVFRGPEGGGRYQSQKFPGLALAEVRAVLGDLCAASGRLSAVRVAKVSAARACFWLTAKP